MRAEVLSRSDKALPTISHFGRRTSASQQGLRTCRAESSTAHHQRDVCLRYADRSPFSLRPMGPAISANRGILALPLILGAARRDSCLSAFRGLAPVCRVPEGVG